MPRRRACKGATNGLANYIAVKFVMHVENVFHGPRIIVCTGDNNRKMNGLYKPYVVHHMAEVGIYVHTDIPKPR